MPRQPRFIVPGQPLHIIQRGNNRGALFLDSDDFDTCRSVMHSASIQKGCHIHTYVFMDNHFHLLVTPDDEHGPPDFMQSVGLSYVRYFNRRYKRTGTLWEGRYRSTVVHSARYFFDCSRYIEMNPVRALMAKQPGEYTRSSFLRNAMGAVDPLITPHHLYKALGDTDIERCLAYQQLFSRHLDSAVCDTIRRATNSGAALGAASTAENSTPGTDDPIPLCT